MTQIKKRNEKTDQIFIEILLIFLLSKLWNLFLRPVALTGILLKFGIYEKKNHVLFENLGLLEIVF